jgi:hypothetical protein
MPQTKKINSASASTFTSRNKTKKTYRGHINELKEALKFSIENDIYFKHYSKLNEYKKLVSVNPTIHMVNTSFLSLFKTSFIYELFKKENKELRELLHCGFLLEHIIEDDTTKSFPAITLLIKHGFNTIYDIVLENNVSFLLYTFLSKLTNLKIIKNADLFIMALEKNPMYIGLRRREAIEELQVKGLFTRIKKFQL